MKDSEERSSFWSVPQGCQSPGGALTCRAPRPRFETDDERSSFVIRLPVHPKAKRTGDINPRVGEQVSGNLRACATEPKSKRELLERDIATVGYLLWSSPKTEEGLVVSCLQKTLEVLQALPGGKIGGSFERKFHIKAAVRPPEHEASEVEVHD